MYIANFCEAHKIIYQIRKILNEYQNFKTSNRKFTRSL